LFAAVSIREDLEKGQLSSDSIIVSDPEPEAVLECELDPPSPFGVELENDRYYYEGSRYYLYLSLLRYVSFVQRMTNVRDGGLGQKRQCFLQFLLGKILNFNFFFLKTSLPHTLGIILRVTNHQLFDYCFPREITYQIKN
jgi:hypothetical protein